MKALKLIEDGDLKKHFVVFMGAITPNKCSVKKKLKFSHHSFW